MKRLLLALLLLIPGHAPAATIADCTCVVKVDLGGGRGGQGSGTHIQTGIVLTCAHVTEGRPTATLTFPDGRSFTGNVVAADTAADLAAIAFDPQGEPTARLAPSDPPDGTKLWITGYPYGRGPWPRTGEAGRFGSPMRETTVTVGSGDSGGGVFTAAGALVGVLSCRDGGPHDQWGHGLIVPASQVCQFVGRCPGGRCPPGYVIPGGQPYQPVAPRPAPIVPAPVTPPPATPDVTVQIKVEIESLRADIAVLKGQIAAVKAGPAGKDGPPGPQGPPGGPGPAGKDGGAFDPARVAALEAAVAELQKSHNQRVRVVPAGQ